MVTEITKAKPEDDTQEICAMCKEVILTGAAKILNRDVCLECKRWMDYLAEIEKAVDGEEADAPGEAGAVAKRPKA